MSKPAVRRPRPGQSFRSLSTQNPLLAPICIRNIIHALSRWSSLTQTTQSHSHALSSAAHFVVVCCSDSVRFWRGLETNKLNPPSNTAPHSPPRSADRQPPAKPTKAQPIARSRISLQAITKAQRTAHPGTTHQATPNDSRQPCLSQRASTTNATNAAPAPIPAASRMLFSS